MILQSSDTTSPVHPIWLPTHGWTKFISTRSTIMAHLRRMFGSHDPILLNHQPMPRFDIRTRTPIPKWTKIWRAHDHHRQRKIPIRNHKTRAIDSYPWGDEQLHLEPGQRQLSTKSTVIEWCDAGGGNGAVSVVRFPMTSCWNLDMRSSTIYCLNNPKTFSSSPASGNSRALPPSFRSTSNWNPYEILGTTSGLWVPSLRT